MPKKKDALSTYRSKRDFSVTPEPSGDEIPKKILKKKSSEPLFVVQKHRATHLHYDVRLQIGHVMPSWAVPKGPSTNPRVKRLAIRTEDHPLGYAYFEGIIPEGMYGAGEVMVWDIGTYKNIRKKTMQQSLEEGKIDVIFNGKKLKGAYAFIRTSPKKNWIFFKMNDEHADPLKSITVTENKSVLTGRTMSQIKRDKDSEIYE